MKKILSVIICFYVVTVQCVIRSEKELIDEIKMLEANFDRFSEIKHYIRQYCHNLEDKEAVKSAIKSQLMFFEEEYDGYWGTGWKIASIFSLWGICNSSVYINNIKEALLETNINTEKKVHLEEMHNLGQVAFGIVCTTALMSGLMYFACCRSSLKKWRKLNYLLHSF